MKSRKITEEFVRISKETAAGRTAAMERIVEGRRYVRLFAPEERLILLGGGHIARPLCTMASMLGFAVTVVDDRPAFANSARFPEAARVVCDCFPEALRTLDLRPTDYVCVITRGHRWDGECLRVILKGPMPFYLGMIGSRRRVTGLMKQLAKEGYETEKLEAVHAPIGLKIGAETTAEIAVSICAELVQARRSRDSRDEDELDRTDTDASLLAFLTEDEAPGALMTVLETRGSTPVESGAMMAIDDAGHGFGTIGGGCGEAEVMRQARLLIGSGKQKAVTVDMSADLAEEEGMVCGGQMLVLVEDVTAVPIESGVIQAVCVSEKKGQQKHPVEEIHLLPHHGIEGDAHAGDWHRQVSLLAKESVDALQERIAFPLLPGAFAENVLCEGIALAKLPVGTRLQIGTALCEVTQIGKECHADCAIRRQAGDCVMPREGIFAVVLRAGVARPGDMVAVLR